MSTEDIAVRVENVSKIYRLWREPKYRLLYALRKLFRTQSLKDQQDGYYDFHALHNASFQIKKGESWGFVGVNGSGKSTLLKMISGNLRLSSGRIEIDGKLVILDYGNGFNGDFTGKENIFLKATLFGLPRKQIAERYDSIVAFAEIGDFINQPVKTYSSGMISRLGFAIIAHVDADIIITDEALAVGDVFFVQKCMKFIRSFLKRGTFLFVSHSTNDVLSLCQKAVWLDKGMIREIGDAPNVVRAYLDKIHLDSIKDVDLDNKEDLKSLSINIKQIMKSEVRLAQPALGKLMNYIESDSQDFPANQAAIVHVSSFNSADMSGVGGADIVNVIFCNESYEILQSVLCGTNTKLCIEIMAMRDLRSPMVGFQITDTTGQVVFADNSYLVTQAQPLTVKKGTVFEAEFDFCMPLLPAGTYGVRAAIAVGEEEGEAVMLHTIDKAVTLRSVNNQSIQGLIGLPMQTVEFAVHDDSNVNIPAQAAHAEMHSGATIG